MTSRIDPITETEWKRIISRLEDVMDAKKWLKPEDKAQAWGRYATILDTLWETGCHPSVLAEPSKNNLRLKDGAMVWRRPKTKRVCVMPISYWLQERLETYLNPANRPYSTKSILRVTRACAALAGIDDVTPKTLRHSVAYELFKKHGPSVAKESLGVSDRVLQDYMALNAETRVRVIREGRKPRRNEIPSEVAKGEANP